MKKKRKIAMPVIDLSPNVVVAIIGGIVGLVLLLCIPGSEEAFEPAYAESKSVTDTWNENVSYTVLENQEVPLANEVAKLLPDDEVEKPEGDGQAAQDEQPENDGQAYFEEDEAGVDAGERNDIINTEPAKLVIPDVPEPTVSDVEENVRSITEKNIAKEELEETKPEEKPKTSDDITNKDKKPEYDKEELVAEDKGGGTSKMVYDSVFGWIQTEATQYDVIDSDGDMDKQIGSMGSE